MVQPAAAGPGETPASGGAHIPMGEEGEVRDGATTGATKGHTNGPRLENTGLARQARHPQSFRLYMAGIDAGIGCR